MKRKHSPVQCDRCYRVFSGTNRTRCMSDLRNHRQQRVPCERGNPALQEGVSEVQWRMMERHNRKKNQEKHKFEKWYEIWDILFPDAPKPETPGM